MSEALYSTSLSFLPQQIPIVATLVDEKFIEISVFYVASNAVTF